jgi:hypothetical protein
VTTVDAKDDLDPATREELAAIAARLDPGIDVGRELVRFIRTGLTLEAA